MKIESLKVENYRSLCNIEVSFVDYYSAISGANNAGKSALLKVIRIFFSDENVYDPFAGDSPEISYKTDFPNWKTGEEKNGDIVFGLRLLIHKKDDAGIFRFIETFQKTDFGDRESLLIVLERRYRESKGVVELALAVEGESVSDHYTVEEVHKKIRSSGGLVFHNSTQPGRRYYQMRYGLGSFLGEFSDDDKIKIKKAKSILFNKVKTAANKHREEITVLLGRLSDKYEVNITTPTFEIEDFPFVLSLGDKHADVPLEEWGSGTQNRTMILLALLRAKKARENSSESDKITPIILIEEPECFLHPSAQAEFGRALRALSQEFRVQTITTTHSPYLLSVEDPSSNILLEREKRGKRTLATRIIETSGDGWMSPFAQALGVNYEDFKSCRDVLFRGADELLLVEGEGDKSYFEELRHDRHGSKKLEFDGEIFAYGGNGFFKNPVVLKFILNRFKSVVITYDLDSRKDVEKTLESLSLIKNHDFFAVGKDVTGHRDIEGLVPQSIKGLVYSANVDLVAAAASREAENKSQRNTLKRLIQEEFIKKANPCTDDYVDFYLLTEKLNKAFKKKS